MSDLKNKRCVPCEGGIPPLSKEEVEKNLKQLKDWELSKDGHKISRNFHFKNFYETMAFVNAVAWIANQEDHHPDLEVSYSDCRVHYNTHAVNGLTENDFICASKVDQLLA